MNKEFNANQQSLYTPAELGRTREALKELGYVHKPEGAYQEEKFSDLLEDHVKTDAEGNITGIVTLHLDPERTFEVQDGIMTITRDQDLKRTVGTTTTISAFAQALNPSVTQQLVAKISGLMGRAP